MGYFCLLQKFCNLYSKNIVLACFLSMFWHPFSYAICEPPAELRNNLASMLIKDEGGPGGSLCSGVIFDIDGVKVFVTAIHCIKGFARSEISVNDVKLGTSYHSQIKKGIIVHFITLNKSIYTINDNDDKSLMYTPTTIDEDPAKPIKEYDGYAMLPIRRISEDTHEPNLEHVRWPTRAELNVTLDEKEAHHSQERLADWFKTLQAKRWGAKTRNWVSHVPLNPLEIEVLKDWPEDKYRFNALSSPVAYGEPGVHGEVSSCVAPSEHGDSGAPVLVPVDPRSPTHWILRCVLLGSHLYKGRIISESGELKRVGVQRCAEIQ